MENINIYEIAKSVTEEALQVFIIINFHDKKLELSFEDLCEETGKEKQQIYRICRELKYKALLPGGIPRSNKKLGRVKKEVVEENTQVFERPKTKNFNKSLVENIKNG